MVGRCRFELFQVEYLCISLLGVNKCLLPTVNIISEKMYWECSVIISKFLKASLQDSLAPMLDKILFVLTPATKVAADRSVVLPTTN